MVPPRDINGVVVVSSAVISPVNEESRERPSYLPAILHECLPLSRRQMHQSGGYWRKADRLLYGVSWPVASGPLSHQKCSTASPCRHSAYLHMDRSHGSLPSRLR